jgi:hypothetical protein
VCTAHQSRQKQKLEYSKQKFGVHLAFFGKLECTKGALQNFFSVWSAQVVHSKLFGVQVVKFWSAFSLTQVHSKSFGVHLKSTPKFLEWSFGVTCCGLIIITPQ